MELWGVTGPMGAGKSLAVARLAEKGWPVIDADFVAREVVDGTIDEGRATLREIHEVFGQGIVAGLGSEEPSLDRRKLRALIAGDASARDVLERLLHPKIHTRLNTWIHRQQVDGAELAFIEGSRLIESGLHKRFKGCILVTAPESVRLARVTERDRAVESETKAIFALQDENLQRAACSVVWTNDGIADHLTRQVDQWLASYFVKAGGARQ